MELMLPLLGLACFYLTAFAANLYLAVQIIRLLRQKRGYETWVSLWLFGNALFLLGLSSRFVPLAGAPFSSPQFSPRVAGAACVLSAPFFWIGALYLFRKKFSKKQPLKPSLEDQHILDIRDNDTVWPPPPRK